MKPKDMLIRARAARWIREDAKSRGRDWRPTRSWMDNVLAEDAMGFLMLNESRTRCLFMGRGWDILAYDLVPRRARVRLTLLSDNGHVLEVRAWYSMTDDAEPWWFDLCEASSIGFVVVEPGTITQGSACSASGSSTTGGI